MADREWSTAYSGANPIQDADPIGDQTTGVMPDLDDNLTQGAGDTQLSSQVEAPRDKLQAIAKLLGDSVNIPAGSVCEILDRDHANGDAKQIRLRERSSDPTNATNIGFIYTKDVTGITELFFEDSSGSVIQLTNNGSVIGDPSPLTTKGDVYTYDTADARLGVGTDGQVLTADSAEATGLKWETPTGGAGGGFDREEEFTATAVLETFTLAASTAVNANTPSGRSVRVYVNGLKHKYSSSSPLAREFDIIAANQIRVGGMNIGDDVEIVYGV